MLFEFATATRIIFGNGTIKQVPAIAMDMGNKILVVTGSNADRAQVLLDQFPNPCVSVQTFQVHGEPDVQTVTEGLARARSCGCNLVIGIGGGSALDTAKAISALLTNGGDILDYLEVIGKGQHLINNPIPFIAIPTTAGTGTEVTRNAVIASPEHRVKVSLRHPRMLPTLAVIDPELTYSMSPEVTASTGLDALTQVLEPFVSRKANPVTDAICREGLNRAACSLRTVFDNSQDVDARENMALVSLFGGLALANAGLGAVHGFAGPIGGMFPAPHGAVCARLLPFVMEANIKHIKHNNYMNSLKRFEELSQILTGDHTSTINDGVNWINDLCNHLHVPPLSVYGISQSDVPDIVEKAKFASSMKGNPVVLPELTLIKILELAIA
ncbi:iron-containing alcohol dehydrogenase [candidate division KSB1 bacterium]|nr:iron-containing alcohol dehydrogenase [candidate division KSB1 bacterium]